MRQALFVVAVAMLSLVVVVMPAAVRGQESSQEEEANFLDMVKSYLERDLKGDCPGVFKTIKNIKSLLDFWRPDQLCREYCKEELGKESLYQVGRYNYIGPSVKCCCERRNAAEK